MFKPLTATIALLMLFLMVACQSPQQEGEHVHGTSLGMAGSRIEAYRMPPTDIQELVNRSHAVVVGTIATVSEPI